MPESVKRRGSSAPTIGATVRCSSRRRRAQRPPSLGRICRAACAAAPGGRAVTRLPPRWLPAWSPAAPASSARTCATSCSRGAPRDLRRQPRDRVAREHRAHPRPRALRVRCTSTSSSRICIDEPVDFVYHLASPGSPIDYLRLPLHTLKVGSYGTHNTLGLAKSKRARFLISLDQRGLRRPARAPAARELLGQRQPDRPARRLRRGQALRRGADDGLPPPAGGQHGDRPDLQHLRRRACARTTAARSRRSCARRSGNAADGVRRRLPDALVLLRRRPDPRA